MQASDDDSPPSEPDARSIVRAGVTVAVPIAVGVVPFGLLAGATPVDAGQSAAEAVGFSVLVFAGASQLAAIEILAGGGSAAVAIISALMINLRMTMYSASLAPHFAEATRPPRLLAAYVLTDQAYALALTRYGEAPPLTMARRLQFYFGAAVTFWLTWQVSTLVGALGGGSIPETIPLDFAIPLVFLALLVPAVTDRPTLLAALVGGIGTVVAAELGVGDLALVTGATLGIVAGTIAGSGDDVPGEPSPGPGR